MAESKRPAGILFIFITMLLDIIGFGLIAPILPDLLSELTGGSVADASRWGGWLMFAYAAMQFVFSPIVGGLSDRFGRRPVILASLFAFSIDFLLCWWAPTIRWFFLARMISGLTGATMTTAVAYIADVSTPEKRAQNFGMIGAAFGLGFIIGPLMGGFIGEHFGSRAPFLAAAGLSIVNWLYGFFVLPESLKPENRRSFDWKRANPVGTLMALGKYPVVIGLLGSMFFIYLAGQVWPSTWSYYGKEKFGWSESMIGSSLAFYGLLAAIVSGFLVRLAIPKLGPRRSIYFGLSIYMIGLVLTSIAWQEWQIFLFMIPAALGGIAGPALQGTMSNQVPPNAQGELQGGLTSLMSVCSVIGPPILTGLFSRFSAPGAAIYFPGAPFLLSAAFIAVSLSMAWWALRKH